MIKKIIKFAIHIKIKKMTYDIAIIGGGIVGAATMYKLQNQFPD